MVDAQVSGTCGGNTIWVQVPFSAPYKELNEPWVKLRVRFVFQ